MPSPSEMPAHTHSKKDAMSHRFDFIDLFAGIGGFHRALAKAGGRCVFASEWDPWAQQTYEANFGIVPAGDITKVEPDSIPSHDILCGGFPCQPFSIAGVSKANALGRSHGFEHATQGTLFFNVAKIIARQRPRAFILENVKNLKSHDKGRTFQVISNTLTELGYHFDHRILDARHWVPQHRERVFIVGFRDSADFARYKWPTLPKKQLRFSDILEEHVPPKYTLSDKLWDYLQRYAAKHKAAGNGFGYGLVDLNGVSRTLSARYYKDGSEILIPQRGKNPRRMTPRECARLMGYPDKMNIVCSDTRAYKQFGNSVVVPVVSALAQSVVAAMTRPSRGIKSPHQHELFSSSRAA